MTLNSGLKKRKLTDVKYFFLEGGLNLGCRGRRLLDGHSLELNLVVFTKKNVAITTDRSTSAAFGQLT